MVSIQLHRLKYPYDWFIVKEKKTVGYQPDGRYIKSDIVISGIAHCT